MGPRSRWHEKAAHRFQFQGALFITRSPGGSARSDPTLVLLPLCNNQRIAHSSTTSQTKSLTLFSSVCVRERVSECGRGVLLSWYVWASGNFRICPLHTPSLRTNARGKGLGNSIRNLSSMRQIQPPLICIEAAPPKIKQILQWKTCRADGDFQKCRRLRQLRPEGIPNDTSQQLLQKGTQISIPRASLHYKVGRQFDQS
jgi:hypothetical protein